jgi:hypothetical protein
MGRGQPATSATAVLLVLALLLASTGMAGAQEAVFVDPPTNEGRGKMPTEEMVSQANRLGIPELLSFPRTGTTTTCLLPRRKARFTPMRWYYSHV